MLCVQRILNPKEVTYVVQCDHAPSACALMLSSLIASLELPLFRAVEADQNVTKLVDIYGGCERILKTPVPLSYTRQASTDFETFRHISNLMQWLLQSHKAH